MNGPRSWPTWRVGYRGVVEVAAPSQEQAVRKGARLLADQVIQAAADPPAMGEFEAVPVD